MEKLGQRAGYVTLCFCVKQAAGSECQKLGAWCTQKTHPMSLNLVGQSPLTWSVLDFTGMANFGEDYFQENCDAQQDGEGLEVRSTRTRWTGQHMYSKKSKGGVNDSNHREKLRLWTTVFWTARGWSRSYSYPSIQRTEQEGWPYIQYPWP